MTKTDIISVNKAKMTNLSGDKELWDLIVQYVPVYNYMSEFDRRTLFEEVSKLMNNRLKHPEKYIQICSCMPEYGHLPKVSNLGLCDYCQLPRVKCN
jgi:hypothetical protein